MKRVLIACEESQAVCIEFRKRGFEAFSCDIQKCSGGHPEWHIQGDAIEAATSQHWDLMIAHPPCTDLAVSGARHFKRKQDAGIQQKSIEFFMSLVNVDIKHIAVENPVCIMSSIYRKPDQIIQPYYFGDPYTKTTCLWLKNLPLLFYTIEPDLFNEKPTATKNKGEFVTFKSGRRMSKWFAESFGNGKERSKTFPGIAEAMAEQWGNFLNQQL